MLRWEKAHTVKKAMSECAKFRCWQRWRWTKRRGSRNFPIPTSFSSRHRCPHRNFAKLFLQCAERSKTDMETGLDMDMNRDVDNRQGHWHRAWTWTPGVDSDMDKNLHTRLEHGHGQGHDTGHGRGHVHNGHKHIQRRGHRPRTGTLGSPIVQIRSCF